MFRQTGNIQRILLSREKHSFRVAMDFVNVAMSSGSSRITIVDPSAENNRHKWKNVGNLGLGLVRSKTSTTPTPYAIG